MDRLEQFLDPSQFREAPVELLTLSACETASGDDQPVFLVPLFIDWQLVMILSESTSYAQRTRN